jgi:hypothetical protein
VRTLGSSLSSPSLPQRSARQTLRVPARNQRAEFADNAGYGIVDLQRALAACDPNNFKRFRQNNCFDPLALRVVTLDKLVQPTTEAGKNRRPAKLELLALNKPGAAVAGARGEKPFVARGGKSAPLPLKGQPDRDIYSKFPEKSLRHRLWNAIVDKKCVRCNGEHLRAACQKPRQPWEDDFEKPDFWTKKAPPAKQGRVQLDRSLNLPCLAVLHVFCSAGLCLIDTCSDVSLARRDVLHPLQRVDDPVVISHLGGEICFDEVGSFVLEGERKPPVTLLRFLLSTNRACLLESSLPSWAWPTSISLAYRSMRSPRGPDATGSKLALLGVSPERQPTVGCG